MVDYFFNDCPAKNKGKLVVPPIPQNFFVIVITHNQLLQLEKDQSTSREILPGLGVMMRRCSVRTLQRDGNTEGSVGCPLEFIEPGGRQ